MPGFFRLLHIGIMLICSVRGNAEQLQTSLKNRATAHRPIVAIIIDDLGYRKSSLAELQQIPAPLTLSIIPFTPYSTALAQQAHASGNEVMVHMPMETISNRRWEAALTVSMSSRQLQQLSAAMIADIPHAKGVNNHGGSLFTQHKHAMSQLMSSLHQHQLFFLDSRTTANSVSCETAMEAGVTQISRDIFLDNKRDPLNIQQQLQKLQATALEQGYAIAIAHPHPVTFNVLATELPKWQQAGIDLVSISQVFARARPQQTLARMQHSAIESARVCAQRLEH